MRLTPLSWAACALLSTAVFAQGSYTPFGTGCPGTGASNTLPGVVLPKGHDNMWGNSNNYWGVGRNGQRYQQVYLSTDIGRPQVFTGYQLRPDEVFPNTSGGTQTYTVFLGYTSHSPATLTNDFAKNYDTSKGPGTQVFTGQVNLPSWSTTPVFNDWHITVKFARPWVYAFNPTENFLFEVQNSSASQVSGAKDAVSGAGANTTRMVGNNGATVATGNVYSNSGLVIKFNTPGGGAVPALSASGTPDIGKSMTVQLAQAKSSTAAILLLGFSNSTYGPIPLPFDLSALGATGCSLLVSMDLLAPTATDASGNASMPLSIPNVPALSGAIFYNQWMVFDAAANSFGLVFSNGGAAKIG